MAAAAGTPGMMQPGMPGMQAAPQKIKPEQWMQMLDFRIYNLQQQLTAIMNQMGINLPPGALVLPPGTPAAPPPEQALPGGPSDPAQQQQAQPGGAGGAGGNSAISPIEPMQGASPELAAGGGGAKQASDVLSPVGQPIDSQFVPDAATPTTGPLANKTAAVAALLRSRKLHE